MFHVVIAALLFVGILGQTPEPCHSPPQWEGRETRVDRSKNYEEHRRLYYDETNKRERRVEEVEVGSSRSFYDILLLHNEGKEYSLDLRTRKCNVTTLTRPFWYRGVLPGSTFVHVFEMGAAGVANEHALVEIFAGNSSSQYHTSIVTFPSCVPVQNTHYYGQGDFEESNYYDISVGISDPMAFIPPSECIN